MEQTTLHHTSKRTPLYLNLGSAQRSGDSRTTAFDTGVKHTF